MKSYWKLLCLFLINLARFLDSKMGKGLWVLKMASMLDKWWKDSRRPVGALEQFLFNKKILFSFQKIWTSLSFHSENIRLARSILKMEKFCWVLSSIGRIQNFIKYWYVPNILRFIKIQEKICNLQEKL